MSEQQGDLRHLETLDRDLARYSNLEMATNYVSRLMVGVGISLVFVLLAGVTAMLFFGQENNSIIVIIAVTPASKTKTSDMPTPTMRRDT